MCKYCENSNTRYLKRVRVIFEYENPQAVSYPDVANYNNEYIVNQCPMCKEVYTDKVPAENEYMKSIKRSY